MKSFREFVAEAYAFDGPKDISVFVDPTTRERHSVSQLYPRRGDAGTLRACAVIATDEHLYVYDPSRTEHEAMIRVMALEGHLTSRTPPVFTGYWEEDPRRGVHTFVLSPYALTRWSPITTEQATTLLRAHPRLRTLSRLFLRSDEQTIDLRSGRSQAPTTAPETITKPDYSDTDGPDDFTGTTLTR